VYSTFWGSLRAFMAELSTWKACAASAWEHFSRVHHEGDLPVTAPRKKSRGKDRGTPGKGHRYARSERCVRVGALVRVHQEGDLPVAETRGQGTGTPRQGTPYARLGVP